MKILSKIKQVFAGGPRKLPRQFSDRISDIQAWRASLDHEFDLADQMLVIFCDAFMFDPEERFKFRPEDTIESIYRAVYPSPWTPDSLEHSFLVDGLEEEFKIILTDDRLEKMVSLEKIVQEIKMAQSGPRD